MVLKLYSFPWLDDENSKMVLNIRTNVFVKEFGGDKFLEFDGLDPQAIHFVLLFDNQAVGAARWREVDNRIKIEKLAIIKDYRGKGFANLLLKYILEDIILSEKEIFLETLGENYTFFEHKGFVIEEEYSKGNLFYRNMKYVKKSE